MAWIWTLITAFSLIWGIVSGNIQPLGTAPMEGAAAAVKLILEIGGVICLWCGVSEVMERAGISAKLARVMAPVITRLFPSAKSDGATLAAISGNVAANMMGLGNAATPLGLAAAERLKRGAAATDELCTLVVLNTASVQLIPSTVAAVRMANGCETPFDILPAVWLSSAASVAAGLGAAAILKRIWKS